MVERLSGRGKKGRREKREDERKEDASEALVTHFWRGGLILLRTPHIKFLKKETHAAQGLR